MPTDPNMTGLIYPTEDDDEDVWDTIMNTTCWPIIGEHDHTTGKGVKIPSAALKINADIAWSFSGTNYSITGIKAVDFAVTAAADVASYASALFVNSSDSNNLYFRNETGTNVKITDGSTLNVSIVGGIGGDYSSISALLDYDDASDTYRFRQETSASVRQYAKIGCADIILREYDAAGDATVPAEAVTLKSPDALAASYSLTMPAALPAAQTMLQLGASGSIVASNTIPVDTNITLSGTGEVKHGERTLVLPFGPFATWITGTLSVVNNWAGAGTGVGWRASAGSFGMVHLPMLQVGWRVKKIKIVGSGGTVSLGVGVQQYDGDAGATATYTTAGPAYVATLDGSGWTVGSSSSFDTNTDVDVMRLEISPNDQTDFTSISITYDIP